MIAAGSLDPRRRIHPQLLPRQLRGHPRRGCLWAIERHLDGRRRDAFLFGVGAALLRPEVWPFIALYGLYLIAEQYENGTKGHT